MTIKYKPTKDEQRIILNANVAFLSRYTASIVAGIGGIWWILKRQKVPLRSKFGFGSLFAGGIASELIGRKWGVAKAKEVLETLDKDSMLRKIMKGEYSISQSKIDSNSHDFWVELERKTGIDPSEIDPVQNEFRDEFQVINKGNPPKTNKYGDIIE